MKRKGFKLSLRGSIANLTKSYVEFLCGLFISRLGDALYTFALPWISYELTGSSVVMGSLFAVGVLPIVLFGPFVGVLVDRVDSRKLMIWTDVLRAVLISFIPILYISGILQVWHLFAVSFVLAVLTMLFDVAAVTVIPRLSGGQLTKANSAYQLVNKTGDMLGPVCAGALIAAIGGFHTLWLDVLSFGATLFVLMRLKSILAKGDTTPVSSQGVFASMAEGFKWLKNDRLNLALSLQAMVGNFGYSMALAILIYYLRTDLNLNAGEIGINMALLGVGGLAGSAIVHPLERLVGSRSVIPLLLTFGTAGFLIAMASDFWLAPGIGFGIVGVCNVAWNVIATSLRQTTVPPQMLGRVLSFSRVLTRLAMPLGAFAGGFLASASEPAIVFLIAALAKAVEVVIAKLWIAGHLPSKAEMQ
ncbi:MFS transporter [Cohnella kolymensis]|uniref:MFS transporter n=1 Tax=Cohnella kolymensis TaxID=1590652 RepID=UPI00389903EF